MTTAASTVSARSARPSGTPVRIHLPVGVRRAVLVVHVISGGTWIGIDVVVAVLVAVGWFAQNPTNRGLAYQALGTFVVTPMLVAGLACLATGLLLGLGTKWGLVRYWWVLLKLYLNLLLCTLILLVLRPGMTEVVDAGAQLSAGRAPDAELSTLFFPPAVSLTLLSLAVVLSVYKPWGRLRSSRGKG